MGPLIELCMWRYDMLENLLNKIKTINPNFIENPGISLAHVFVKLDEEMADNSFYTDIGEQYITISANNEADLFYGLMDLLQKVSTREILRIGLSEALVDERAVHIDCGRKYFSKRMLKDLIKLMASEKLNTLQLHFSEDLGYRLESKKYSKLTSIEHLTQDDIKEIIAYAKAYYIEVVPSFDTPGHLEHILSHYPEYRLDTLKSGLDITSKEARDFIKSLYDEILEIFEGAKKIHIGADEFIDFNEYHKYPSLEKYAKENFGDKATAADTFVDYVNDIGSYLMDKGLEVRIWNDGFYRLNIENTIDLDPRFVVTYWTSWHKDMAAVQTFVEKGHKLLNYNDANLYYVIGENAGYTYPTVEKIEENFDPLAFSKRHDSHTDVDQVQETVLGCSFSVWSDMPEAKHELDVIEDLNNLLPVYGGKLWKFIVNL